MFFGILAGGGPQDGGKIKSVERLPKTVYVGPKWLGDGWVAYSCEHSARFPCCYVRKGNAPRYVFNGGFLASRKTNA